MTLKFFFHINIKLICFSWKNIYMQWDKVIENRLKSHDNNILYHSFIFAEIVDWREKGYVTPVKIKANVDHAGLSVWFVLLNSARALV